MRFSEESNRDRLRKFMLLWSSPARRPKPCPVFKLFHKGEGGTNEPVTNEEIDLKLDEVGRISEIDRAVESFHDEAVQNAGQFPRQQYYVIACYTDSHQNTVPKAQTGFWCEGLIEKEGAGLSDGSEDITEKTALALMIRSFEAKDRQASLDVARAREAAESANHRVDEILDKVLERNRQLEDRNLQLSAALQGALNQEVTRATLAYGEKKKIDREDRMWLLFESQLPKLLDRWGGGPLGALVKSLRADQVLALYPTLDPEQKAALAVAAETYGIDIKQLAAGGTQ